MGEAQVAAQLSFTRFTIWWTPELITISAPGRSAVQSRAVSS